MCEIECDSKDKTYVAKKVSLIAKIGILVCAIGKLTLSFVAKGLLDKVKGNIVSL